VSSGEATPARKSGTSSLRCDDLAAAPRPDSPITDWKRTSPPLQCPLRRPLCAAADAPRARTPLDDRLDTSPRGAYTAPFGGTAPPGAPRAG
jgi:hypothetical protein